MTLTWTLFVWFISSNSYCKTPFCYFHKTQNLLLLSLNMPLSLWMASTYRILALAGLNYCISCKCWFNTLSTNHTKWSHKIQTIQRLFATNCFSMFDHFMGLGLKGLTFVFIICRLNNFKPLEYTLKRLSP